MRSLLRWLFLAAVLLAAACSAADTPAVLLISIDGFRWDYLDRFEVPALRALAARGVRADLIPAFPSKTFPNHYTIATGLYPAHHGIVSNNMIDPDIPGRFGIGNRKVLSDPRWWGGEPIWNTAERQGLKSAPLFWPGSDTAIGGRRPTYWLEYDGTMANRARVEQVLTWLRRPADERPAILAVYFSDVDDAGHDGGPDSADVAEAAARIDREIAYLVENIEGAGLGNTIDIIVVSDHGMAALSADRQIVLDGFLDPESVGVIDSTPVLGLAPKAGDAEAVYRALAGKHPSLSVYRNAEIPPEFRLAGHPRVPPVIAIAAEGWHILWRQNQAEWSTGRRKPPGGDHGYDPRARSMHGLFIAAGPRVKQSVRVPAVENVHLYAFMCALLGIEPAPNDGDPAVMRGYLR